MKLMQTWKASESLHTRASTECLTNFIWGVHTWWCSGFTPGSRLRDRSWSRDHPYERGIKSGSVVCQASTLTDVLGPAPDSPCSSLTMPSANRWPWNTRQPWQPATWTWRTWSQIQIAASLHWPSPHSSRQAARAVLTVLWSRSPPSCPRSPMSSRYLRTSAGRLQDWAGASCPLPCRACVLLPATPQVSSYS